MEKDPRITLETDHDRIWIKIEEVEASAGISEKSNSRLLEIIAHKPEKMSIDMESVDFIDSAFLGVLVSVFKTAKSEGIDIALFSLRSNVKAVFSLTRLDRLIPIYPDRKAVERKWEQIESA